jgi:antitoxin (DNA-binding transcriptional repressor) of toxin-antitoxin stability system
VKAVGVKVLKSRLSEYIRIAAGGETILVTDRDRVVAEIGPPRPHHRPLAPDASLADAVRRGWITPPSMAGPEPPPRIPVRGARLSALVRALESDRADR